MNQKLEFQNESLTAHKDNLCPDTTFSFYCKHELQKTPLVLIFQIKLIDKQTLNPIDIHNLVVQQLYSDMEFQVKISLQQLDKLLKNIISHFFSIFLSSHHHHKNQLCDINIFGGFLNRELVARCTRPLEACTKSNTWLKNQKSNLLNRSMDGKYQKFHRISKKMRRIQLCLELKQESHVQSLMDWHLFSTIHYRRRVVIVLKEAYNSVSSIYDINIFGDGKTSGYLIKDSNPYKGYNILLIYGMINHEITQDKIPSKIPTYPSLSLFFSANNPKIIGMTNKKNATMKYPIDNATSITPQISEPLPILVEFSNSLISSQPQLENQLQHINIFGDGKTGDYLFNFSFNFSISTIYDSKYPQSRHTNVDDFTNFGKRPLPLFDSYAISIPKYPTLVPLSILILPHFGHSFITIITNNQKQNFSINIFGDGKRSDYLRFHLLLNPNTIKNTPTAARILPRILRNKISDEGQTPIVTASGIMETTIPKIISIAPNVISLVAFFSILISFCYPTKNINIFGG